MELVVALAAGFVVTVLAGLVPLIPWRLFRNLRDAISDILNRMPRTLSITLPGVLGALISVTVGVVALIFSLPNIEPSSPPPIPDTEPSADILELIESGGEERVWQFVAFAPSEMEFNQSAVISARLRLADMNDVRGTPWATVDSSSLRGVSACVTLSATAFEQQQSPIDTCRRALPTEQREVEWQWSIFPRSTTSGKQILSVSLAILEQPSIDGAAAQQDSLQIILFHTLEINVEKSSIDRHPGLVTAVFGLLGALFLAIGSFAGQALFIRRQ